MKRTGSYRSSRVSPRSCTRRRVQAGVAVDRVKVGGAQRLARGARPWTRTAGRSTGVGVVGTRPGSRPFPAGRGSCPAAGFARGRHRPGPLPWTRKPPGTTRGGRRCWPGRRRPGAAVGGMAGVHCGSGRCWLRRVALRRPRRGRRAAARRWLGQGQAGAAQCGGEVLGQPVGGVAVVGSLLRSFYQLAGVDAHRAALAHRPVAAQVSMPWYWWCASARGCRRRRAA